jgi:two-component system phosphate regulon sensor histidine kinase PhoR
MPGKKNIFWSFYPPLLVVVLAALLAAAALARMRQPVGVTLAAAGVFAVAFAALISAVAARAFRGSRGRPGSAAESPSPGAPELPETGEGGPAEAASSACSRPDEKIRIIAKQRRELEAVLSIMSEAVLVVNSDLKVVKVNRAAARILKISAGEVQGRSMMDLAPGSDLDRFVKLTLSSRDPVEGEATLAGDEGQRFFSAAGTTLKGDDDRIIGAVVVLHDVTALRRLETMRREFIANISHELRTPITSIKGFVDALKGGAISDAEEARTSLDIISKQSDRLNTIVEDILSLTSIEEQEELGQIPLEKGSINDVFDTTVPLFKGKAEEKQVNIDVFCPPNITAMINAPLLEQAISNLLDNAIKYSDPGGTVEVRVQRRTGEVVIKVSDTGPGIPPEHMPRLFERFYTVDQARSRSLGGTGLGLAIVKHIVESHHGRVSVESTPGKGSTFFIYLPEN